MVAAACSATAVTAVAAAGAAPSGDEPSANSSRAQNSMRAMSVLRSPRDAADAPTSAERGVLTAGGDVGAAWSDARRVRLNAPGQRGGAAKQALVVPAEAGVCLVMDAAATCPSDESFADTGGVAVLGGFRPGEPIHLDGLAVDGITSVDVHLNNGQTLRADVVDNAFGVTSEAWPLAVSFKDAAGRLRTLDQPLGPPRRRG
jgi:hypothetical protein